ncbi:hypothetical protein SAMN03080594_103184 [Arenibacter palladensis]|uniref:Uncharacterized protein n=1 Tax=Arenibacter palladensis TaxID=237373 RepID=A0A1M5AC76_9FLAO|nr:hypothetical protein SAMN03080594_103184 [Arenibacter palladensis]
MLLFFGGFIFYEIQVFYVEDHSFLQLLPTSGFWDKHLIIGAF